MRSAPFVVLAGLVCATPAASQPVNTVRDALEAIESGPTPATDPGTWVRTEDYPLWAAERGVTGTVAIVLDVDASGRVAACEIGESSGVPDFDRLACEKVTERAQFRPARDEQGNPVAGRWQNRVVWALPPATGRPIPEPAEIVVSMVVESDGSVSKCVVERAEGAVAKATTSAMCDAVGPFEPPLDAEGNPQRRRIRLITSIEHQPLR